MRTNIASFEQSISSGVTICRVRPINRYRPINRIGALGKSLYRIGIGSADYKGLYRLIGYLYYNKFFRHKKNLTYAKLVQIPD